MMMRFSKTALMLLGCSVGTLNASELDEAKIFFELNDTDGDLGLHGKVDGGPWRNILIRHEDGRRIFLTTVARQLREQGMTELFFESAEPKFNELSPDQFFARFPDGIYTIYGHTTEGERINAELELSHVIPAAPDDLSLSYQSVCEVNGPSLAVSHAELQQPSCLQEVEIPPAEFELDDEGEQQLVCVEIHGIDELTISWGEVTQSHREKGTTAPHGLFLGEVGDVTPVSYQVVLETETDEELEVVSSNILPPGVTEFEFSEQVLHLSDEFKFEILVRDQNGNQSATEGCFEIVENEVD